MATRVVDLGNVRGPAGQDGNDGMACRPARLVVGTTAAGWTAADCDYLCTGSEDQTQINAAIAALHTRGGEIILLDGTYNVGHNAPITLNKANVTLRGNGPATRLQCTTLENTISVTAANCTIRDLYVYSKRCNTVYSSGSRLTLLNVHFEGGSDGGDTWIQGTGAVIMGCRFTEDKEGYGYGGLNLQGSGHVVMGNVCCELSNSATGCAVANNVIG